MAMLDIEYRFSDGPVPDSSRRKTVKEMEDYIRSLVLEMQMADISVGFKTVRTEGPNDVLINGRHVADILNGLEIKMLEPDEGCEAVGIIRIGRDEKDWNEDCIEDISDVLMKNAISKVYSEMEADRIM